MNSVSIESPIESFVVSPMMSTHQVAELLEYIVRYPLSA
jgi:hypothetical protein